MTSIRSFRCVLPALAAALVCVAGCADMEVTNPNDPDRSDAVDGSTAEALVAGSFENWHDAQYQYTGPSMFLSAASFQHSSPWSCPGQEYFARIPRQPIINDPAWVECGYFTNPWYVLYDVLAALADGMGALDQNPDLLAGTSADRDRLQAFGRFVQGLAHGSLALLYDQGFIRDETSPVYGDPELVPYDSMMAVALGFLEEAAALAEGGSWTIPAQWMSVEVSADQLVRLAHSYAARFRAAVARTPAERAAVDWSAVMADIDAGITEDWVMDMDYYQGWYAGALDYSTYPGWSDETYWIIGMADQSGSYQAWLQLEPNSAARPDADLDGDGDRDTVLIVTPDTRFAQGTTIAEQEANPGSLYVIPDWGIQNIWKRPDRGTWRWSYYWHIDTEEYTYFRDFHWPEMRGAEMRLLKAEGLLRQGNAAGAAALINVSRTAAGLSATDAAGANTDCVPRLPDNSCGGLMEMLKWEKRLETHFSGLMGAPWYFEGRGWGDLFRDTYLQFPVPCADLEVLQILPCYTFGGAGGDSSAPVSVYRWPAEMD